MGIAVATHRATPSQGQPPSPAEAKKEGRPPKKCHYLPTPCRACGAAMTVTYPLAVTFWKFTCASCSKPYSIEIVGHHKCLVYDQLGRRTVERIGLTQTRSVYYRAKCYGCNTVIIAASQEVGTVQSCHHCQLDFTIRGDQNTLFYETVIQHQEHPVIFRDKVQVLEGHILNKNNMFFLDEDISNRTQQAWVETLSQLENELIALRSQEGSVHTSLMQLQAEKNDLDQQLKQQMDKGVELTNRLHALEEHARGLATEKQAYAQRASHFDDLVRTLEQKTAINTRLANRVEHLNHTIRALSDEKQTLMGKLGSQTELLNNLEQEKVSNNSWLNAHMNAHRASQNDLQRLQKENKTLTDKTNNYNDVIRDLDRQGERASKFENMYQESIATVKKLVNENHRLVSRLTGQEAVLHNLERQTAKVAQFETLNRDLSKRLRALQDNPPNFSDTSKSTEEHTALEARLSTLQRENQRLEKKAREQSRLETRIIELQTELNLLRHRGNDRSEPKEDWYCEEGEEASITPQEQGFQERRILGIKGEATPERIKAALRKRIRKYHPDMVASMGVELRELAHRKTQEITRAYSHLMSTCK